MAKQQPAWILRGMDAPPPVTSGYHDYGVVYDPAIHGRPHLLANLISDARWALWSWKYWGAKVRKQIRWNITQKREARS